MSDYLALNDSPSAIAAKFGFTLEKLTDLQNPIFRKVLDLKQEVSLNNSAYRKMQPKDIVKNFWINGQGTLWTLTEGDELLVQEPSLEFLKKIKLILLRKNQKSAHKKEDKTKIGGTNIFDQKAKNAGDNHKSKTRPKHFMEVTGLFALLGAGGETPKIKRSTKIIEAILEGVKWYLTARANIKAVKEDALNLPPNKVEQYANGLKYMEEMQKQLEKHKKENPEEAEKIRQSLKKILSANFKYPPLGHEFYEFHGGLPKYLPSMRHRNPPLFVSNYNSSNRSPKDYDTNTLTIYYKVDFKSKSMIEVGFLNNK